MIDDLKQGDLIKLGNSYLLVGDSTDKQQVDYLFSKSNTKSVELVLTDPPYGISYSSKSGSVINDEDVSFYPKMVEIIREKMNSDYSSYYIFCCANYLKTLLDEINDKKLRMSSVLIWAKENATLSWSDYRIKHEFCVYGFKNKHNWYGDNTATTLLTFKIKDHLKYIHPTEKPIKMFRYLIGNSSKLFSSVLDLFAGSGTTLIACEEMRRKCLTFEIHIPYCKLIINRFEKQFKKNAVKIGNFYEDLKL